MPNICLMIGTTASANKVFDALTTLNGLNSWWTTHTSGNPDAGGKLEFRFPTMGPDMEVTQVTKDHIIWTVTAGIEEWIGTQIHFNIEETDTQTLLYFKHADWAEEIPFFHHCSTKWAVFMLSLKQYLETGSGRPFPNDVHIEMS
ncbi:SRPBCC domain-containing protein [Terasakiella sp. A23]|uniref:SRPBCC family protein n=1 Tax=Terasakiella sp. FCG-A23 TaxID=3080561 RepID=UPI00295403D2|nr:SRPBCC domain-containing protein [Terasakiella sp. A23]MDV7339738.1 SRPBCC domain-containing protein [Terasakiella sp. A23]